MKARNPAARQHDVERVFAELEKVATLVPDKPAHLRIFRYNAAHAPCDLGRYEACVSITGELIPGLTPANVVNKNPDTIWPLLSKGVDHGDDLKHPADCLDLQAHPLNKLGRLAPLARIHVMKFYSMTNALDSRARTHPNLQRRAHVIRPAALWSVRWRNVDERQG